MPRIARKSGKRRGEPLDGWTALLVLAGVVTACLRRDAEPLLPPGQWHGLLSGWFVVAVWASRTWLLRWFARCGFRDPLSWFNW
jgi:hypothetical protein